jgi:hypothetical protein
MAGVVTIALIKHSTGGIAFKSEDDTYVLAEQLDAKQLVVGQRLDGHADSIGFERLVDPGSGESYAFFVQAYGLGLEAVSTELG